MQPFLEARAKNVQNFVGFLEDGWTWYFAFDLTFKIYHLTNSSIYIQLNTLYFRFVQALDGFIYWINYFLRLLYYIGSKCTIFEYCICNDVISNVEFQVGPQRLIRVCVLWTGIFLQFQGALISVIYSLFSVHLLRHISDLQT